MIRMSWDKILDIIEANLEESEENKVSKRYFIDLIEGKALTEFPNCLQNITHIGSGTFYHYSNLSLTSLPDSVVSIGSYAFYGCTNLSWTSLPEGVTTIGDYAFGECSGLTSLTLPSTITNIGVRVFEYCDNLHEITFTNTPTNLSTGAFYASSITTINVPWAEGEVAGAPWGAENATVNYNYSPT